MKLSQQTINNIQVINLEGWLDMDSSDIFQEAFDTWLKSSTNFVFDCSRLEFIDSTGLGRLLLCLKQTMKKDGDIKLAKINEKMSMFLEITKANDIFQIFPTVEEAVDSYST